MSQNDVITIGPYKYTVLKREGTRMLLAWVESTGISKELWVRIKQ